LNDATDHPSYRRYIDSQKRYWKFFKGETSVVPIRDFDDMSLDESHATARINKIYEVVMKTNSIFMKNEPVVHRWPYYSEDADLSNDQDALYLDAWEDTNAQQTARNMLLEAQVTGLSIGKIYWDAMDRSFDRNGSIGFQKCEPESVVFEPWASNAKRGRDAGYIFHTTEQPIGLLLAKYGNAVRKAWNLPAKGRNPKDSLAARMKSFISAGFKSLTLSTKDDDYEVRRGYAAVTEVWLFPQKLHASDLVSGDAIKDQEYEYGIVATVVGDEIVRCMPNPFVKRMMRDTTDDLGLPKRKSVEVGHRRHPFVPMYWARIGDIEGMNGKFGFYDCAGAVESMISVQVNINALRRNVAQNARVLANPIPVVNEDAIQGPVENLQWHPTQVYRIKQHYRAQDAIQILQGAQMPEFVHTMIREDMADIEKAAGFEPGVVGLFPTGGGTSHTSGPVIGSIQEAAFGPLWTYVNELGVALLDMSILYDGNIQQFYKPDRYMTVSKNGIRRQIKWTNRHITANFKRKVIAGATTPMYDIEKQQRVGEVVVIVNNAIANAMQMQDPTIIEVAMAHLEAMDFPWAYDFQQILAKKYEELLQLQQGAQMMGEQMLAQSAQESQLALPSGGGEPTPEDMELGIIEQLAEIEGRSPEEIAVALAG
jgi:hypothetical protein